MKTVSEARIYLKQKLKNIYADDELPEILFLTISFITQLSRTQQFAFPETELTQNQTDMLLLSAQKLQSGMPVQYVLGEADFFGLKFNVDPSVLIPRPETEELVSWVLEKRRQKGAESGFGAGPKILDIGTGSGCIAISIKKNWPEAAVFGLDISAEALKTAKQNALLNEVEVNFFQQDILDFYPVKEALLYDVIVSNPPYITPSEQKKMQPNVLDFEPHLALFVPENDPLLFYRAVAGYASFMLKKNGLLFFEINEEFGAETVLLLKEQGFIGIEIKKDFRQKERMIKAVKV